MKKHFSFLFSLFALATLALPNPLFLSPQRASASPNSACNLSWELVPAPSFPGKSPSLYGMAHSASNDVWAFGRLTEGEPGAFIYPPLILHWNGVLWSQVALPDLGEVELFIDGITAISPMDAWAVGSFYSSSKQIVILHWNGSAWSHVSVPQEWVGYLSGIGHASANQVWAIGYNDKNPLLLFWDGVEWSNNSDEMAALGFTDLNFVRVRNADDVYIAGEMYEEGRLYAAVAHWNGTDWNVIAKRNIVDGSIPGSTTFQYIGGLAILASDDIWMSLGHAGISAFQPQFTFLRWQGDAWETIEQGHGDPLSLDGSEPNNLYGMTFWQFFREVRYWDGMNWKEINLPLPKGTAKPFSRVRVISESEAWVVGGEYNAPNKHQPYIAHGTSPCAVPPRPRLSSPEKGQILQRTDPTLKWEFTPGANFFQVTFRQMHTPDRPVTRATVTHAYFKPPMVLNRGESHRWRVRACNNNGCGRWSKAREFFVVE